MRAYGAIAVLAACGATALGQVSGPWNVSVFTGGNLDSASAGFAGNVTGAIVSRGNVYGNGLNANGGVYAQSSVGFSGTVNGGIRAGGNVTLSGGSVSGGIRAGGSLLSTIGTTSVSGGAILTGSNLAGSRVNMSGAVSSGVAYVQPLDFAAFDAFYRSTSNLAASLASNNVAVMSGTALQLRTTGSGTQVFSVTAAQLAAAQSVVVDAAAGTTVIVNLLGSAIALNSGWSFVNGANADHVLLNAAGAFSVDVSASNIATVLAPDAYFTINGANVHGSIIGLGAGGRGDISGNFAGVVPSPGAYAILVAGGVIAVRRRRASA
jgi:choice-of-anchor A domain-containing protein